MAKIRVYELAKKLNMSNKVLLTKLEAMNIEVKSHMSSLEDETVAQIKENLFGKKRQEEIRVRSSVIRRRRHDTKVEKTTPSAPVAQEAKDLVISPGGNDSELPPVKVHKSVVEKKTEPDETREPQAQDETESIREPSDIHARIVRGRTDEPARIIKPPVTPVAETVPPAVEAMEQDEPQPRVAASNSHDGVGVDTREEDVRNPESDVPKADGNPVEEAGYPEAVETQAINDDEQAPETIAPEEITMDQDQDQEEQDMPRTEAIDSEKPAEGVDARDKKRKKKKGPKKTEPAKIIKLAVPPPIPTPKARPAGRVSGPEVQVRNRDGSLEPVQVRPTYSNVPKTVEPVLPSPEELLILKIASKAASPGPDVPAEPSEKNADDRSKRKKEKKKKGVIEEKVFDDVARKGIFKKRKSVVEGKDLYEKERGGKKGRKKGEKAKKVQNQKTQITIPKAIKRRVKIDETIELSELAKRMGIKANEMIQKLMGLGVMATVNQTIDYDTACLVAAEFEYEVEKASLEEDMFISARDMQDDTDKMIPRPPVVTIMGHVDHGKTSLLDVIRKSKIVTGEAGGITQHIGAYSVKSSRGMITFLDTPGHAAFTSMRSRGAKVTDLVVLVVAADDGVMPQTIEAINHSKAASVPVVVAVNKMDKPGADPDRVMRELADHGLVSEEWGGDTIFAKVSAKAETGINNLLEMILLQAEVLELKANPNRLATGHVIEASLDVGRGPVATILIEQGSLKAGQAVVCGLHSGRIRAMVGDTGETVTVAGPSTPVEIVGLSGVPEAGDEFVALESEKDAKQISDYRMQKQRAKELAKKSRANLEKLFENMGAGEIRELKLIIKADVNGSMEALNESVMKLAQDEVNIKIVHSGTGAINESDVSLAAVSDAIIIGFNVRPNPKVRAMAKEENVDMRFYDIIYNVINDIKAAITGMMPSTFHENILGRAEVRDTFVIPNKGTIAGSFVVDGKLARGEKIRLLRDGVVKCDTILSSLRRFKDDVKEVTQGYECGIGIDKFNDIKVGDIFECYEIEEIKAKME
ncbi:MAG: translation initiation factor IF-2 [Pseudomonadota bacterium]